MVDTSNPQNLTPEQLAQLAAVQEYQNDANTLVELGRSEMGDQTFDALSQDVADAVGSAHLVPLVDSLRQTDIPTQLVAHLAQHPEQAREISRMPHARRAVALARIESELLPSATHNVSAQPAWKRRVQTGNHLTDLADDESFSKAWDRRYLNKGKR